MPHSGDDLVLHNHLNGARRLLSDTTTALGIATRGATTIATGLTAVGLSGIVRSLQNVSTALDAAHAHIQTLVGRIKAMTARSASLTSQTSPQDLLATLAVIAEDIDNATAHARRIDTTLTTAQTLTRTALNGGQPQHLIHAIQTTRDVLSQVAAQLTGARNAVTSMAAQARLTGAGPSDPASGGRNQSLAQHPIGSGSPPEPRTLFDPVPHLEQMPVFQRRPGQRPKTHGRWTDADGRTHALVSGQRVRTPTGDEIADPDYLAAIAIARDAGLIPRHAAINSASHVELKFAAYMRRHHLTHATITINNPAGPCGDALGCDALLGRYLEPHQSLTVHWPRGCRTYHGRTDT